MFVTIPARIDGTPSFVCKNAVTKPAHAPASIAAKMARTGCPAAVTVTDTAEDEAAVGRQIGDVEDAVA